MRCSTLGSIVTIILGLLCAPLATDAQPPAKVPRIGYLAGGSYASGATRVEAFRQGLQVLGYREGQTIAIEYRYTEGKPERFPDLAAELVDLKVDVIVTSGEAGIRAAKQATRTIPIVVALAGDLVGPGHIASLARPGGNITGLSTLAPESMGKRLQLLKEALPQVSRVAVLWNPTNAVNVLDVRETEVAARTLGVQLYSLEMRDPTDVERAFAAMREERPDALLVFPPLTRQIVEFAAQSRLPAMYEVSEYVDAGGLMSYGPNVPDLYRRAAVYVDKILRGATPADLPVEQPMRFEFVINLKTAQALGLTIPPIVLFQADEVIK